MLVKYHPNGNPNNEFVNLEFEEMQSVIAREIENKVLRKSLVQVPGNGRRTLIVIMFSLFSR